MLRSILGPLAELIQLPDYGDEELQSRAVLLRNMALLVALGSLSYGVLAAIFASETRHFIQAGSGIVVALVIAAGTLQALSRQNIRTAGWFIVTPVWLVLALLGTFVFGPTETNVMSYLVPVAIAGLVLGGGGTLVVTGASVAFIVVSWLGVQGGWWPTIPVPGLASLQVVLIATVFVTVLALFVDAWRRNNTGARARSQAIAAELTAVRAELEARISDRTQALELRALQLRAAADVGRAAASLRNLDELLPRVSELISERFGFYQVGVFLLDTDRQYAVMRAANSPGGKQMLARNHRLRVGEQGIVGYVTAYGEPRIALDVGGDAVFFDNPELPHTRSEMALPLTVRGEIIGALDVQSTAAAAFSQEDVEVLAVLADQVAVAISNALLFEQAQQRLEAERRAIDEVARDRWSQRRDTGAAVGYLSDERGITRVDELTRPEINEAAQTGKLVVSNGYGSRNNSEPHRLAIPIKVRGAVIGVLNTVKPANTGGWQADEITLLKTVAEQLGVALEGARLYEETQQQAGREQTRANIASRVLASSDVDVILRTAIEELGKAFDAAGGTISLEISDEA